MRRSKQYILIAMLSIVFLFGISATCNMCGFDITTPTTAAEVSTSETIDGQSDQTSSETAGVSEETAAETTLSGETASESSPESSSEISPVELSKMMPVFAIANEPGEKLITYHVDDGIINFQELNGAIGEDGQFYAIEYVGMQSANNQDSFRVVASNFDNMEGHIYNNLGNNLTASNSYYLCNSGLINKDNLLSSVSSGNTNLDNATKTQISGMKNRGVQDGWIIDEYSEGTQVLVVVFEPDGNNLLMSIALKTADKVKFMDYPVVSDGQSAWRVDDGGKINPKFFTMLFTARTDNGLLSVINWAGAEGESTLALLEGADFLTQLPWEVSRYWSPA